CEASEPGCFIGNPTAVGSDWPVRVRLRRSSSTAWRITTCTLSRMRHCWRGSAGWLQQYRKQKGELQGRTPNSELQEFGVRPCNSPFCYSLFSDTWSIHTVPAIELSNRHDGRRKTRISTSLTGESTMSFPPSFFQSVVPLKRSVSISS